MSGADIVYYVYLGAFCIGIFYAVLAGLFAGVLGHFGAEGGGAEAGVGGAESGGIGGHPELVGHGAEGVGAHGAEGVTSAETAAEHPAVHLSPVSPITIATFITTFGGIGVICTKMLRFPPILSVPVAIASGFAIAAAAFYLLAKLFAITQSTSEARLANLMGIEAEVLTPIPADGVGQVVYVYGGTRYTRPARSEENKPIGKHAMVRITRIVAGTVYVRELVEEKLRKL